MKLLALILMLIQIPAASEALQKSTAATMATTEKDRLEASAWMAKHQAQFEKAVAVKIAESANAGAYAAAFHFWEFADKFGEGRSVPALHAAMDLLRKKGYVVDHGCWGDVCSISIVWSAR